MVGEVWPARADLVERENAFNGTCCKDPDRKEEPWRGWFPVFVIFLLLSRWFGTLNPNPSDSLNLQIHTQEKHSYHV